MEIKVRRVHRRRWTGVAVAAVAVAVVVVAMVALWPTGSSAQEGTPTPQPTATPIPTATPTALQQLTGRVDVVEGQITTLTGRVDQLSELHVQQGAIRWDCSVLLAQQSRSYRQASSEFDIQEHVENLNLMLGSHPLSETGVQAIADDCGLTLG